VRAGDAGSRSPKARDGARTIKLLPGPGFGTGAHPTTRLCLQALGFLLARGAPRAHVLDFGSGSGILSVAAALAGSRVEAVEIDQRALAHARENAVLNGVAASIDFRSTLSQPCPAFDLVLANVLRPVLLDVAQELCSRQSPAGHLVLSGLVGTDVPEILACYRPLLAPMRSTVYESGEWRAVMFSC
jgi:ribosomal protein L11 methyltransferase